MFNNKQTNRVNLTGKNFNVELSQELYMYLKLLIWSRKIYIYTRIQNKKQLL